MTANGIAGGISSEVNSGSFNEGFKMSAAVSFLTLANYKMRQAMIKESQLNPDNFGKESEGFFGDGVGLAGTRRVINPGYGGIDDESFEYLVCDGPAGGCQGPQIQNGISVGSRLGPISYSSGGLLDRVAESFAGPHDWLSSQVGMYDALGNGVWRTGFMHGWYETMSYGLIPVAAPFFVAGLIDTANGVHSFLYTMRYGKSKAL